MCALGHEAGELRTSLVAGEPCPVCLQPVSAIPGESDVSSVAEAEAALRAAQKSVKDAEWRAAAIRGDALDGHARVGRRSARLLAAVDEVPGVETARAALAAIAKEIAAATREREAAATRSQCREEACSALWRRVSPALGRSRRASAGGAGCPRSSCRGRGDARAGLPGRHAR